MGRRALVTGGSRGIGRAIARALTEAGHSVTIAGRNRATLEQAVTAGVAAEMLVIDVTDEQAAAHVAARTAFEILVNNAGGAETAPFGRTDRAAFRRAFALNVESVADITRACLPAMIDGGFGRVINIASMAGLKGYAYVSAYVSAKHAVVGLTRALALEVVRKGVTVNAICPGYTDTDLVAASVADIVAKTGRSADAAQQHFANATPLGRLVQPEEVAAAAVWLASEQAGAVTGQCIAIAGGET